MDITFHSITTGLPVISPVIKWILLILSRFFPDQTKFLCHSTLGRQLMLNHTKI